MIKIGLLVERDVHFAGAPARLIVKGYVQQEVAEAVVVKIEWVNGQRLVQPYVDVAPKMLWYPAN